MILGFIIGVWTARYLGPLGYGAINYTLSVYTLFAIISTLGLESVLIHRIISLPNESHTFLGTGFLLRLAASGIAFLGMILIGVIQNDWHVLSILFFIMAPALLLQSFDIIEWYFQSKMNIAKPIIIRSSIYIVSNIAKIAILLTNGNIMYFMAVSSLEISLIAISLYNIFRKQYPKFNLHFDFKIAKALLQEGWPFLISTLSYMIYTRIDQIMLGIFFNPTQVGTYTAATKVTDIVLGILIAMSTALFPLLSRWHGENKAYFYYRLAQLTSIITFISYGIFILFCLSGPYLFREIFGEAYTASIPILYIQMFGLIFLYNGALRSSYLTLIKKQKLLMWTTVSAAIINIMLNLFWIPKFGGIGAAIATCITQVYALFISNFFISSTQKLFRIQVSALIGIPLFSKKSLF